MSWGATSPAVFGALFQKVIDLAENDRRRQLVAHYTSEENTMPPSLVKAHRDLDRAVDAAYMPDGGKRTWASDAERVAFLFALYQEYTSLLTGSANPDAPGSLPGH